MSMASYGIPLDKFPNRLRPYTNITPFTYRDGLTYLEVLESLREWIRNDLVKHLDIENDELVEQFNNAIDEVAETLATINTLATQFDDQISAQDNDFTELIRRFSDSAVLLLDNVEAIANRVEGVDTIIAQLVADAQAAADKAVDNSRYVPALIEQMSGLQAEFDSRRELTGLFLTPVNIEAGDTQIYEIRFPDGYFRNKPRVFPTINNGRATVAVTVTGTTSALLRIFNLTQGALPATTEVGYLAVEDRPLSSATRNEYMDVFITPAPDGIPAYGFREFALAFPAGKFLNPPRVFTSPNNSRITCAVKNITTTSAILVVTNQTSGVVPITTEIAYLVIENR